MPKYLIRLDDACPTMNRKNWSRIEYILDKYNIKPLIGIIPKNRDKKHFVDTYDNCFWVKVNNWQSKNWSIAMHGYDHVYINDENLSRQIKKSEFAGISLKLQEEKIKHGIEIFKKNKITPNFFFAPNHTFDNNTLIALLKNSNIRKISDTTSFRPYKNGEFIFFPQQFGRFRKIFLPGYWTFSYHPNIMNEIDFLYFELFIEKNSHSFITFDQINIDTLKRRSLIDDFLNIFMMIMRWVRYILH